MTAPKTIMIIILMASFAFAYEDLSDIYRLKLYIKKGDKFRLDLMRLMSFYNTSINFSSNNGNVKIPGIPLDSKSQIYFEKQVLRPKIFKTENSHMIYVSNDGRVLYVFRVEGENAIIRIDNKASGFFNNSPDKTIYDVVLDQNSNLVILYHNVNDSVNPGNNGEISYHLYVVNYATNIFLFDLEIKAPLYERPAIKLMSRSEQDQKMDPTRFVYLIFDKSKEDLDKDTEPKFTSNTRIKLLTIHRDAEDKFLVEQEQIFKVNDILFGGRSTEIRVHNIMVASKRTKQIFFYLETQTEKKTRNKYVYHASFNYSPLAKEVKFSEAKQFIDRPVTKFFMKESYYIYITKDHKLHFCDDNNKSQKSGNLMKNWKVKNILFEKNHAIVVMSIKSTHVVFINDFDRDVLTFYYDTLIGVRGLFLSHSALNNDKRIYIAEFLDQGFKLRDVTLNTMMEIVESDLVDKQAVSLRLDDQELVDLDIERWDGELVVDQFNEKPIQILKTKAGQFRTQLGYAGKDLHFRTPSSSQSIKYFNDLDFKITYKDPKTIEHEPFYLYQDWVFFNAKWVHNSCKADKSSLKLDCQEIESEALNEIIDVSKITRAVEVGSLIVLLAQHSSDIKIFNMRTRSLIRIPANDRFKDGSACSVSTGYIVCKFDNLQPKIQTLRVFYINGETLEEIAEVEKDMIQIMEPYLVSEKGSLTAIEINHYGFDTVESSKLSVLFKFIYDAEFKNRFFNFDFKHALNKPDMIKKLEFVGENTEFVKNADVNRDVTMSVLDSQVIFTSYDPKFAFFCFDGDSYYEFQYLDTSKPIDIIVLESHNIVIFIYQKRDESKAYYYTIFRITQNSVKQLIRTGLIENYNPGYRLSAFSIDPFTIAFIQYNQNGGQVFSSSIYFQNGPILLGSNTDEEIIINDRTDKPNYFEDKLFNISKFKYEKDKKITIGVNQERTDLKIRDYVKFIGNVANISISKESAALTNLQVSNPLVLKSNSAIDAIETESANDMIFVKETEKLIVYNTHVKKNVYTALSKTTKPTKTIIEFNLPDKVRCYDVEISELSLICFWTKDGLQKVSIMPWYNNNQEDFVIPRKVASVRVMEENANYIAFISKDEFNKFISIIRIDKTEKTTQAKYIGKKEMNVDDLRIIDYYHSVNINDNRLTIIMLDGLSNQLLFFHSSYQTLNQQYVLKRMISLNDLDLSIIQIDCKDVTTENNTHECFLYSPTHIFLTRIKRNESASVSYSKWDFTVVRT